MDERTARMALSCVVDPGDIHADVLVSEFGAVEVWAAVRDGRPERWAGRARTLSLGSVERLAKLRGIRFVVPGDDEWPGSLSELGSAEPLAGRGGRPLGLWMRGPRPLDAAIGRSVAIVGSRAATSYGESVAGELAAELGAQGVLTVSGGAYGVDSAAHRGALSTPSGTVAVLACGLDRLYPAGNSRLLERIADEHLLVSEAPPGAHPTKVGFLARNRLIAALAQGTVLVEAAVRSGARNTASWTCRLGRVLMAVPGSVHSAASVTPHRLIRDGEAVLITSATDAISLLGPLSAEAPSSLLDCADVRDDDLLTPTEKAIVEALPARAPRAAAELALAGGVPYGACLAALATLADRGVVAPAPHGEWRLADRRKAARG